MKNLIIIILALLCVSAYATDPDIEDLDQVQEYQKDNREYQEDLLKKDYTLVLNILADKIQRTRRLRENEEENDSLITSSIEFTSLLMNEILEKTKSCKSKIDFEKSICAQSLLYDVAHLAYKKSAIDKITFLSLENTSYTLDYKDGLLGTNADYLKEHPSLLKRAAYLPDLARYLTTKEFFKSKCS